MAALAAAKRISTRVMPTDLAAFSIGGRQVLVDFGCWEIGPGDEAVVFDHDGRVSIMSGPLANDTQQGSCKRMRAGHWITTSLRDNGGHTRERPYYFVLGRII